MKICKKCREEKPHTEFHRCAASRDGRKPNCKKCVQEHGWDRQNKDVANARKKQWALDHPEETKAAAKKWYATHPETVKAASGRWARENPEKHKEYDKAYKKAKAAEKRAEKEKYELEHAVEIAAAKEVQKERARKKKNEAQAIWAKENPELQKQMMAAWLKENRAHQTAAQVKREAQKLKATPGWTNMVAVDEFYAFAAIKTRLTGVEHEVDHIVPLRSKTVCGLNSHYNLQVLSKAENLKKGNRVWPDMWA